MTLRDHLDNFSKNNAILAGLTNTPHEILIKRYPFQVQLNCSTDHSMGCPKRSISFPRKNITHLVEFQCFGDTFVSCMHSPPLIAMIQWKLTQDGQGRLQGAMIGRISVCSICLPIPNP